MLGRLLGDLAQKQIKLLLGELDELLIMRRAGSCRLSTFNGEWPTSSQLVLNLCEADLGDLLTCEVGDYRRRVSLLLNHAFQEVVYGFNVSLFLNLLLCGCRLVVHLLLEGFLLLLLLCGEVCLSLGSSCRLGGRLGVCNSVLGLLRSFNLFGSVQLLDLVEHLLSLLHHLSALLLLQEE